MKLNSNPIYKRGERNIHCPFYSECLDHAVKHFWHCWSCSQCPYRKIKSFDEAECDVNSEELGREFLTEHG